MIRSNQQSGTAPKVELIYDVDCPNVESARNQLRQALANVGAVSRWQEWDRNDPASPAYAREYGSPTILVEGKDVAGVRASDGANCCRIYRNETGHIQGVPSSEMIVSALQSNGATADSGSAGRWRAWAAVLPAVGVSLLPNLACPACWPAYAGLLGAVGLGFLTDTAYLLPLTGALLVVAVGALGFRANHRRGYAPFVVGVVAATVVLVGKFLFESDPAMYGGVVLLVGASLWNSWPRTSVTRPACGSGRASDEATLKPLGPGQPTN